MLLVCVFTLSFFSFTSFTIDIMPLSSVLFPQFANLNSHHAFIVRYKLGEDVDLSKHVDRADVTLNVCLGTQWTGI